MTLEEFTATLSSSEPPKGVSPLLEAMWYDAKDNWEAAHNIAQDITSDNGAWVHAYLHRKEGDLGNAAYWYRRTGRPVPRISLGDEWQEILINLVAKDEPSKPTDR